MIFFPLNYKPVYKRIKKSRIIPAKNTRISLTLPDLFVKIHFAIASVLE